MADLKNPAASALARLRNKAIALRLSYQQCLQLFVQEEFLRRLARSPYHRHLVLKGGLFLYTLTHFQSRPTMDVDFLMQGMPNTEAAVREMLDCILSMETGYSFVTFTCGPIKPIALEKKYNGLSVQLTAHIQNVRIPFSIDMGVGDIISPVAQQREAYALLPDETAPRILTYSLESTIAEKFQAMIHLLELNSRMKDFYDIYDLSLRFPFSGEQLQTAIRSTLQNRGTVLHEHTFPRLMQMATDAGMNQKWAHFQRTLHQPALPFPQVMEQISTFLAPVIETIETDSPFPATWFPETGWRA